MIDLATVIVVNDVNDNDDDDVSFTLSWNEPFANFDPIVNYTVTIHCTNTSECPMVFVVATTTANVNSITDLSMMTSIQVTATNTIGKSNPATIKIVGAYVCYIIAQCTYQSACM